MVAEFINRGVGISELLMSFNKVGLEVRPHLLILWFPTPLLNASSKKSCFGKDDVS